MPEKGSDTLEYRTPGPAEPPVRDDIAYLLPMMVFLGLVWVGGNWSKEHPWTYPAAYAARTFSVAGLLFWLWPYYTKISWRYWWVGVIVGIIGIFQWVPMQLWLQDQLPKLLSGKWSALATKLFGASSDAFNPETFFHTSAGFWSFVAVRMIGAVLVVPVMEELFWRDFLWRQILAPNDFKLAKVGEFGWAPFLIVPAVFALVHGNWWLSAVVWGLMIAVLLVTTKSLGACIIAHGVTNLLLALYVLKTHDWAFW
jgi:CAAX prenyl protease-like protein